jgi:hypothetical protein
MRNRLGSPVEGDFDFGVEFDTRFAETAASPDQLAAVWNAAGEVVTVSPVDGSRGAINMDVVRHPSELRVPAIVNAQRTRDLNLPQLGPATHYLTAANEYSERTRILALDGEKLSMSDDELLEWLMNAEKQMSLGTDNHPVFETSLEETACSIRRLPNGQISMTEVPRQHIDSLGQKLRSLTGERPNTPVRITIETPIRCSARYFLTSTREGKETLRPGKAAEVTAFMVVTSAGYSLGLWSPRVGLFSEYAFLAPDEIRGQMRGGRPQGYAAMQTEAAASGTVMQSYLKQTFDQLLLEMSADKLENLQLSSYSQVVWAAERGMSEIMAPVAAVYAAKTGLEFVPLNVPVDEAVAAGLLLGSYAFGDTSVAGAENLPPINLAHDILAAASTEEMERHRETEARAQARRSQAAFSLLAAPVLVGACILALVANLVVSNLMTAWAEAQAEAKTVELKPALDRRRSYEANLKWYQEFITEVSKLRRQQPVGIGLLYQLNANYPLAADPSFFVSDMKLTPAGEVELKGLSRNKDAVASFLKALEFAGGDQSGARLFTDLAYEVQEAAPITAAGQTRVPTLTGTTLGAQTAVAPGVVVWSMRGKYVPLAEFAPKQAAPAAPGAANPPAPAVLPATKPAA